MGYITHNGYKLFYAIQGQGDRALIFIHGLCGDHRVWSKNIPAFTGNFRTVAMDMFGHGNSSKDISPKEAFESLPLAVTSIIKKEKLKNAVIVGHSIAGNILLNCIEQDIGNVKGYVFVDCAFNANEKVVNSRNQLADSLLNHPKDQLDSAVITWYKTMMDMKADPKDNELILSAFKNLNAEWALDFLKATNIIRQPPKTNLPVLIFESDWLTKDQSERSFYKVLPKSEYCHFAVLNHFFFVYEAGKFNQRLGEFLKKILQ